MTVLALCKASGWGREEVLDLPVDEFVEWLTAAEKLAKQRAGA